MAALCVTALGDNVKTAQKLAYATAGKIEFCGRAIRHDIEISGRSGADRRPDCAVTT